MRISDWSSDVCSSDLAGPDTARKVVGLRSLLEMAQDSHASVISSLEEDMKRDEAELERGKAPAALGANAAPADQATVLIGRSEEHTSELQSLMRISYAVFCLQKNKTINRYIYVL